MKNCFKTLFVVICFSGCLNPPENAPTAARPQIIAQAKIVHLDSAPAPLVVPLASMAKPQRLEAPPAKSTLAHPFYQMTTFGIEDGLPREGIRSIMQDKRGNLWLAVLGGAIKYDGKSFTTYSVAQGIIHNEVKSIYEGNKGTIWINATGGVSNYDGKDIVSYTSKDGLADDNVLGIFFDSTGNIWFRTRKGVSKFNNKVFTNFTTSQGLPDDYINGIIEDSGHNLWFYGAHGISKYNGHSFENFSTKEGLASENVMSAAADDLGNIWFGTANGISKFNGNSFLNVSVANGFPKEKVFYAFKDGQGRLWFGTENGVRMFDGTSFSVFQTVEGLISGRIRTTIEDKGGNIWFLTDQGVCKYDGTSFIKFSMEQGLPSNDINTIFADAKGTVWFGTSMGLTKFEGTAFTTFTAKQGLPEGTVWRTIEDKKGNLWFAARKGLTNYDGRVFLTVGIPQGMQVIRDMVVDKDANFWIGTSDGIVKYDGKVFEKFGQEQGLPVASIHKIAKDNLDNLWFATYDRGVVRYDGKSFVIFTEAQGLVSNLIHSVFADRHGNVWFGSQKDGVTKFDGKSFTSFSTIQEIGNNSVIHVFEDSSGNIWLSHMGGGISRFDGTSFINFNAADGLAHNSVYFTGVTKKQELIFGTDLGLTFLKGFKKDEKNNTVLVAQNALSNTNLAEYEPVFESFTPSNGYPVYGFIDDYLLDSSGITWIPSMSDKIGLVRFDAKELRKNTETASVFVENIKIKNENIAWNLLAQLEAPHTRTEESVKFQRPLRASQAKKMIENFGSIRFDAVSPWYYIPQNLQLPYSCNDVEIEFGTIDISQPKSISYMYYLDGFENSWSEPTRKTSARFNNLREGNYQFKVKAMNGSGLWGEPTVYSFTVLPPWYRTWWAYAGYAIVTLLSLYLIYLWRTAALRKRQRELEVLYASAQRFLPKDFLQILKKEHFQDVNLGDSAEVEKQTMFSDIRGFTSLTEKLGPKGTALVLNKYMGYMAPIIREYDGVVGQFLGDGILAFFDPKPELAIDAGLVMQKTLAEFNRDIKEYGLDPVDIGIGLNIGQAMFSIIGEKERLEGHVISDSVNLSARVESLNKFYGTNFLITGDVYDKIAEPSQYLIRLIDKVIVMGKHNGVRIYEVRSLPEGKELQAAQQHFELFSKAFFAYEQGKILEAEKLFRECFVRNPTDQVSSVLEERCAVFRTQGIPEDWDGTYRLTEK